jgi:hypothetical protein
MPIALLPNPTATHTVVQWPNFPRRAGSTAMPDLLALLPNLTRLVPLANERLGSPLVRPESRPMSQEATPWLFDYAAFLREQQDCYCQGS